jgi:VWFA-related protein
MRCFKLIGLLLIFGCSFLLHSKDMKKEASQKGQPSYAVKVRSVVVSATVTDKAGNPVTDLTLSDFRVYDDGNPQKIQTFALESFGPPESEETKASGTTPRRTSEQKAVRPRLISIVIDDLTMDTALGVNTCLEFPRMADAIKKFIKDDVGPMDQVAILSGSRKVQFSFSNDKQRLLEEVAAALPKLNTDTTQRPCNSITDLEAYQMSGPLGVNQSPYFRQLARACWDDITGSGNSDPAATVADFNPAMDIRTDARSEAFLSIAALRTNGDAEYRTRNLKFQDVAPGKYRLAIETTEPASLETATLQTDLELTTAK